MILTTTKSSATFSRFPIPARNRPKYPISRYFYRRRPSRPKVLRKFSVILPLLDAQKIELRIQCVAVQRVQYGAEIFVNFRGAHVCKGYQIDALGHISRLVQFFHERRAHELSLPFAVIAQNIRFAVPFFLHGDNTLNAAQIFRKNTDKLQGASPSPRRNTSRDIAIPETKARTELIL